MAKRCEKKKTEEMNGRIETYLIVESEREKRSDERHHDSRI